MDLNLIRTFAKVSELGSFTRAAKELNQPKSRVSRAISRLESDLGVELVRRTTRRTNLTTAGEDFYQRVYLLISQLEQEVDYANEYKDEVEGLLRITAPEDLSQTIVAKIIAAFNSRYPKVKIKIIISNDYLDLTKENIDLAFRAGKAKDSNLIQRKLFDTHLVTVASKKYLQTYGHPNTLEDLKKHRVMLFGEIESEKIFGKKAKNLKIDSFLRTDSFPMLLQMALQHQGITVIPAIICNEQVKSGELQLVFPENNTGKSPINLVYPPTKNMPKKTRAFIDTAVTLFS